MAWRGDRDESMAQTIDARVASIRFAEFVNMTIAVCEALAKKKR
jgi:hypothetical protein